MKTKAQIICAVAAQLISAFVFWKVKPLFVKCEILSFQPSLSAQTSLCGAWLETIFSIIVGCLTLILSAWIIFPSSFHVHMWYCNFGNVRENLIFANINESKFLLMKSYCKFGNVNENLIMPPTLKKLERHIAFGLSVCLSVCLCVCVCVCVCVCMCTSVNF